MFGLLICLTITLASMPTIEADQKRIEVAVGVVVNGDSQILVGQRVVKDDYFQKWEFPGGKVEQGETVEQALIREFYEETGLKILGSKFLMHVRHDYQDRAVSLHVHLIKQFSGDVQSREGQALRWVDLQEIDKLDFLQGNSKIITRLKNVLV